MLEEQDFRGRDLRRYTKNELKRAIRSGARCVNFYYCYSCIHTLSGETDLVVVKDWKDRMITGILHCFPTAILGWWGLFGILLTPFYLAINLTGGRNRTQAVLRALESPTYARWLVNEELTPFDDQTCQNEMSPEQYFHDLETSHKHV